VQPSAPAEPATRSLTEGAVENRPVPAPTPSAAPDVERKVLPDDRAPVLPFSGRVVVRATPPGARVLVDGRDRGAAPATITDLARGEHRIRVVHDGYTAAERRVVLSTDRPSQVITVPLAKAPVPLKPTAGQPAAAKAEPTEKPASAAAAETGVLVLDSRPTGAAAFVDGRAVGKTPVTLPDVKAGDHNVRFELSDHRPWSASIKVGGGTINRVGGSLEKID
jgi:PEGA domain-containing protein